MKRQKDISYQVVSKILKKRFLPAIILVTLIILVEQVMIHNQLANNDSMSHIMNDAGHQRMLSQRITKDALLLYHSTDSSSDHKYLLELKESVEKLEESQSNLLNDNHEYKLLPNGGTDVATLLLQVHTNYESLLRTSKELIKLFEDNSTDSFALEHNISVLLSVEEPYLTGMDNIVSQCEQEYTQDITLIQNTKLILFIILIAIILFVLFGLFIPATKFLAHIFREVNEAHENILKVFQNVHEVFILIEKNEFKVIMMSNLAKEYFLRKNVNDFSAYFKTNLNDNWKHLLSTLEQIQATEELMNMEITLEMKEDTSKVFLLSTKNETFQNKEVIIVSLFDISKQKSAEETLRKIAIRDELTGLYNRHFLDTIIEDELERSERYHYPMSLILLDLDHFKHVNDTWGHPVGDLVLKQTADTVSNAIRRSDYLIRFGGEEFIILMPHTNLEDARIVAEKIRHAIESQPHPIAGVYTASFGVTQRVFCESFHMLYEHADAALYRAKNEGRNRVVMYTDSIDQNHSLITSGWKSEWNSGDDKIDEQHKKLLVFANDIMNLSHLSPDSQRETEMITLLIQHISQHFEYEESVLKEVGYQEYKEHVKNHKDLIEKIEVLKNSYQNQEVGISVFLTFLIDEVVIGHLFDADTQFFIYLKEKLCNNN